PRHTRNRSAAGGSGGTPAITSADGPLAQRRAPRFDVARNIPAAGLYVQLLAFRPVKGRAHQRLRNTASASRRRHVGVGEVDGLVVAPVLDHRLAVVGRSDETRALLVMADVHPETIAGWVKIASRAFRSQSCSSRRPRRS